ncbi:MAG: hypothetical protein ABEJ05_00705 [Haloglomus sp.]
MEPLAALAAVFAVTLGLGLYVGALHGVVPEPTASVLAPMALDAVAGAASGPTGVVDPERLSSAVANGPDGHRLNLTLAASERRWRVGPSPPTAASDRAARRVAVAVSEARTAVGRLRVVVW